jgi:hypothetical protein
MTRKKRTYKAGWNGKNIPFKGDTKEVGNIVSPFVNRKQRRSGMPQNILPNSTKVGNLPNGVTPPLRNMKQLKYAGLR